MNKKIFISVFQAMPNVGSDNHVGFYIINRLLEEKFDIYLFTPEANRIAIEDHYSGNYPGNLNFLEIKYSFLLKIFKPNPYKYTQYVSNILWEVYLRNYTKQNTNDFDLYYQINPSSWWAYNGLLNNAYPTLIGPLMGFRFPGNGLWNYLGIKSRIFELIRLSILKSPYALINKRRIMKSGCHVLIDGDIDIFNIDEYTNTSHTLSLDALSSKRREPQIPKVILGGRFVDIKGYAIALECLSRVPRNFIVEIYGEGPYEQDIRNLIIKYNLETKVELKGIVSRSDLIKCMRNANVLIAPYIRENASVLVAESLYNSLPVVAIRDTGPASVCKLFNPGLYRISYGYKDELIENMSKDVTYFLDNFTSMNPSPSGNFGNDIVRKINEILDID